MLKVTMGGLVRAVGSALASTVADGAKDAVKTLTGIEIDGNVPIRGYHGKLAKADPDGTAAVVVEQMPPLSSLAARVQHAVGVTSYDITPGVGPQFAWKPAGVSSFEVAGQKVTILEMAIGSDREAGAKSSYTGRSFLVLGNGWAAEAWVDTKANGVVSELLAETGHNLIVDGAILNRNGFRGLARRAKDVEPAHAKEVLSKLPPIDVPDALVAFVRDGDIPGLSPPAKAALAARLERMPAAPSAKYVGEAIRRDPLPTGPSMSLLALRAQ